MVLSDSTELKVRFRTLGCYPLTGGIESDAETLDEIIDESTETDLFHLRLLTRVQAHSVVIHHDNVAVSVYNRTLFCKIKRKDRDIFSLNVLPDIRLSPVGNRENTDAFAFIDLRIIKFPHLRTLVLRIPGLLCITEGEDTLFCTAFLLVTTTAAKSSCETIFLKSLLQCLE